ncbi:MAG: D-hexose-6-phosphate mutarotase, partial [Gammaproteobacteria bacterium]|nr:D-hexose-6-phosphate mutarotase [Gammaproteobacteria bacterium]
AQSAVVWNPGSEIVKDFSDIDNAAWPAFVCVESGNVFDNRVTIKAGEQHALHMKLSSI